MGSDMTKKSVTPSPKVFALEELARDWTAAIPSIIVHVWLLLMGIWLLQTFPCKMVPRSDFPASRRLPSRVASDFGTGASSLWSNVFTSTSRPDSKATMTLLKRSLLSWRWSFSYQLTLVQCKVSQRFSPSVALECHGTLFLSWLAWFQRISENEERYRSYFPSRITRVNLSKMDTSFMYCLQ